MDLLPFDPENGSGTRALFIAFRHHSQLESLYKLSLDL